MRSIQVNVFSHFSTKTYIVYSLEVPHQGTSNEYLQPGVVTGPLGRNSGPRGL